MNYKLKISLSHAITPYSSPNPHRSLPALTSPPFLSHRYRHHGKPQPVKDHSIEHAEYRHQQIKETHLGRGDDLFSQHGARKEPARDTGEVEILRVPDGQIRFQQSFQPLFRIPPAMAQFLVKPVVQPLISRHQHDK